ncbi:MAG: trypsin-like peptidase domain-containing protein [Patescibacteria group bacterium]
MKKVNLLGFIQIPILIAITAGGVVLGGVYFWGKGEYKTYQAEKNQEESRVQMLANAQQKSLENAQAEIEKLKLASAEAQKKQSLLEQKIKQESKKATSGTDNSYSKIPLGAVVKIDCWESIQDFLNLDKHRLGSGVFMSSGFVLTNRHVINNNDKTNCIVFIRDEKDAKKQTLFFATVFGIVTTSDAAFLGIKNLWNNGDFEKIPIAYVFPEKTASCKESDLKLGAKLAVVGYPTVGGDTITITDGIVSGFDGDYIKTSAKIEHGNSGGGAFLVPSGCWIGIPTASVTGEIESLGRILRWDA